MMNRRNQILTAIFAIQIVIAGLVFWPRSASSDVGAGPLLADFKATDVASLTISDADGKQITLTKSGEDWVLPDNGDFSVTADKVPSLLDKIEGLKSNRLVTQTEASHKRLKVAPDDFNRLIEIKMKDGTVHKLYLGSTAGANTTHVRADGQSEVYLTNNLAAWDVNPQASSWIDTIYFTVPQTATVALTLQNANGTFEFQKDGEQWTMKGLAAGETFNENNFTTLLNQATKLNMVSPIGKEEQASFGLANPQAVVTLKTKENDQEKSYTLKIGAKNADDNTYVVSSSESPYYVRVAEFTGKAFVEKTRDNFLQLPPTPTPAPDSTTPSQ